jgi:hypothetical protein
MSKPPRPDGLVEPISQDAAVTKDLTPPGRKGEYLLVQSALPKTNIQNIGVLLLVPDTNRLYCRFRRDFEDFAGDEAEWFKELPEHIMQMAKELGAQKCLEWMESTLSNTLQISSRKDLTIQGDAVATVDRLYVAHIRPKVLQFRTHLPQYSLEAAAGRFGRQMAVEPEGWVEVDTDLPLTDDMFVAHVEGHSMEPRIPDASLCAFGSKIGGSWDGKVLLIEDYSESGESRYTVKLCKLSKIVDRNKQGDTAWLHQPVSLESINPAYKPWEVGSAEKIEPIGEFLFVVGHAPSEQVKSQSKATSL